MIQPIRGVSNVAISSRKFFLPTDVRFGRGALAGFDDFVRPGERVFIVADPGVEKAGLVKPVQERIAGNKGETVVFNRVEPNPTSQIVLEAVAELKKSSATAVVAVGGGSSLDVGKVVAALATNDGPLEEYQWHDRPFTIEPLPFIAIPTTAGTGSEVTRVAVIVDRKVKKGINSDRLFPRAALVDPELMTGLPPRLTAATGLDALSHAVEAYVGINANSATDAWALEAIKLIGRSLWRACGCGTDLGAREDMAVASTLAGAAMDQAGLGIVHSMAGPLCTHFHLPHGEANTVLLPYGMRFNLMARPERFATIASALGCQTTGLSPWEAGLKAVEAVDQLIRESGLDVNLAAYGLSAADADLIAEGTEEMMFLLRNNPRLPSRQECREVFLATLERRNPVL
jgi:alcohol dehydrogenase